MMTDAGAEYFEVVTVVRKLSDKEVVVYRCLKKLPSAGFVVQSADRVHLPVDRSALRNQESGFFELFAEREPGVRDTYAPSLEEAIEAFHAAFS